MHVSTAVPVEYPELETSVFSELTVIIPTLNEARCIGDLLDELERCCPGVEAIISDDGSADGTRQIVRDSSKRLSNIKVQLLERDGSAHTGLCASVLDAIESCKTKYFVVMDADFQHPPEHVKEFLAELAQGTSLVAGVRENPALGLPLPRLFLTIIATALARTFLRFRGLSVGDPLSGFFGGDVKLIQRLIQSNRVRFEPKGYKILFDLLKLFTSQQEVKNVTYRFDERTSGRSKFRVRHALYFARSFFN